MYNLPGSITVFLLITVVAVLQIMRHKAKIREYTDARFKDLIVFLMWVGIILTQILF